MTVREAWKLHGERKRKWEEAKDKKKVGEGTDKEMD